MVISKIHMSPASWSPITKPKMLTILDTGVDPDSSDSARNLKSDAFGVLQIRCISAPQATLWIRYFFMKKKSESASAGKIYHEGELLPDIIL